MSMLTARPNAGSAEVVVLTHFPSPYQVELFNEIERQAPGKIAVIYLHRKNAQRQWSPSNLQHAGRWMDEEMPGGPSVEETCSRAGLVVFNFYDDRRAVKLLNERAASGWPWCFWGERPGYLSPLLGRLRRLWTLAALHRSRAPVWGIGKLAVAAYREEYGAHRDYVNLPYFSNLERFVAAGRDREERTESSGERVILYSGSLIHRKGVDLVAQAFARAAQEVPEGRLLVMGTGKLEGKMRRKLSGCLARVEFTGFQDWRSLPSIYGRADVLCVPSRHDGWGLVVPEGLAAGLPVISTTATGAAVEFIQDRGNGWLLPPSAPDELYLAIKEALTVSGPRLKAMSEAARATVAGHELKAGAERFLTAAEQVVSNW